MKKNIFFLILGLLSYTHLFAQEVRGLVVNERGDGLNFANVILITKTDSAFISGVVTEEDGHFLMNSPINTSLNNCLLKISCIGYQTIYTTPRTEMGTISLSEETQQLSEVVVSGKHPVIEMKQGIIQANIQHSVLSRTGDGIQVLAKLPFISQTTDGISVFGRGTPLIYIDNLKMNDISELKKLSSNEIKRVEIDLHPNASYGNNTKAVIKVTTIRKGEGLSVSLIEQGTLAKHLSHWEYVKLNYRHKKWDFFTSFSFQQNHNESTTRNLFNIQNASHNVNIDQHYNDDARNKTLNTTTGINYSNKGKNDFGIKYDFTRTPSYKDNINGYNTSAEDGISQTDDVLLHTSNQKTTHALNAYYTTSWAKASRLMVNADYLHGERQSKYETYWTQEKNVETKNRSNYHLLTGKAEFFFPVWDGELHTGAEYSFTKNKHSYDADQMASTALHESEDENRQNLWGLFVSQTKTLGKFSIEAGGRLEITNYQYIMDGTVNDEVSKTYKKLLPYFEVDFDNDAYSMSLSYNNYVRRPSYSQLNSSTIYVDKYTYQRGNPLLLSAHDYELDYTFSWKDLMVDITHTWHENRLMQTTQQAESTTAMIYTIENIPHYREWGITISYSPTIGFWTPKAEINVFKQNLTYLGKDYHDPYFCYEFDNLFQISKHVNLSLDMWGTAAGDLYLSTFRPAFRTDIGLNAYLLKNKLAVWLKISDLFNTDKERWYSDMNGIYLSKVSRHDNRGVMLQLRYTFNSQRSKYKGATTSSEIMRF